MKKPFIPSHTEYVNETFLNTLLKFDERDLTIKILIPLFKAMGYDKVDYHHGPYEGGKDLICWKKNELQLLTLTVVQIKKYKLSAKQRVFLGCSLTKPDHILKALKSLT